MTVPSFLAAKDSASDSDENAALEIAHFFSRDRRLNNFPD